MTRPAFPFAPELRPLAAGLAGDPVALQRLLASSGLQTSITEHRLGPALAIRAAERDLNGGQIGLWNTQMRAAAGQRLQLEAARRSIAAALADADIPWAPLKGMGLDPRLYPHPEERISTDIDVLVAPEHLRQAVAALESAGWESLTTSPRQQRQALDEGYNWKLALGNTLLELHFRLWGGVPERLAEDILARTTPAPEIGPTARRVDLPDAYLIAAVHVWQTPPPRYLMLWWDLQRMAETMTPEEYQAVIDRTLEHDLGAFVALSAATAADLWDHPVNHQIADALEPRLGAAERWAAARLHRTSPITASLGLLTLGRLLARRPSRSGWRAVPRRIWAHPGTVDAATPDTWPWPKRRLTHLARALHIIRD